MQTWRVAVHHNISVCLRCTQCLMLPTESKAFVQHVNVSMQTLNDTANHSLSVYPECESARSHCLMLTSSIKKCSYCMSGSACRQCLMLPTASYALIQHVKVSMQISGGTKCKLSIQFNTPWRMMSVCAHQIVAC